MINKINKQQSIIRIGTRGSPLALMQANEVKSLLVKSNNLIEENIKISIIKTTGDKILDKPLSSVGGKGLFTKEIEEALINNKIDIAVHSLKDMPTKQPTGLLVNCFLEREDPRDAFISTKIKNLARLHSDAIVGTSSLRRKAQILNIIPTVEVVEFRGNVQTRLKKLENEIADCTFLAIAGLKRLNLTHLITEPIPITKMLPAVAQGIICIEQRSNDHKISKLLKTLNHKPTMIRALAERTMLEILDGSCQTPIAGLAIIKEGQIILKGEILKLDGSKKISYEATDNIDNASKVGQSVGLSLLKKAGRGFLPNT
ncbi:MAG: hydroxymethylbilane synthase [Paracoccaceae bacterium]|nr:hydroxymethylbilane synthase [Paracoccaceae bacterium]